jgi:hypothetical protein
MDKQVFAAVRRILAPTVLAGITVIGTLGFSSVAQAASRAGSPAADGSTNAQAAPSHPHGVMSGACGCMRGGSSAARPAAGGSMRSDTHASSHAGSSRSASLPAHGGYGASSGSAHAGRNYRAR